MVSEEIVFDEPSQHHDSAHQQRPAFGKKASSSKKKAATSKRKVALLDTAGPSIFKRQASSFDATDGDGTGNGSGNTSFRRLPNTSPLVIFPWSPGYKIWWGFTVFCACLTIFTETYNIAFTAAGLTPFNDGSSIVELILVGIFVVDIVVNFCLAYNDDTSEDNEIVRNHKAIAAHYLRFMFWLDLLGVFPFYALALGISGEMGNDSTVAQYLSLLRLVRFVRLHRLVLVFEILQYSSKISLMSLTLTRNFTAALVWCHFNACVFFFIARQYDFDPDSTFIGGALSDGDLNGFERYLTSLYFTIVTFTTVGYGDYSPVNSAEQIWGIVFMLVNIIFASWVIGSITLLIVKADEKTGQYRDSLETLDKFSSLHGLEDKFHHSLKTQLKLDFGNREVNEAQVLSQFPTAVRRKVLRRLYLPDLMQTQLLTGLRQQFLDAFLSSCKVEIISVGEDLLQRGSIASDLYFLVGGTVRLLPDHTGETYQNNNNNNNDGPPPIMATTSIADSDYRFRHGGRNMQEMSQGQFINEIGFFTESPQRHTVRTKTVCNTLTLSRADYKLIAADYPDCVSILLHNLLEKVKIMKQEQEEAADEQQQGSYKVTGNHTEHSENDDEAQQHIESIHQANAISAVEDLIQAHMHKLKDDHTTQFLFAASRGDVNTIVLMCENGLDPNTADYDMRTALMVASMKGHVETVAKLLEEYHADPNKVDMHGSSALYEAATNGHDDTVQLLLKHGGKLCMSEGQAASKLCQAVYDGDMSLLRRLLQAQIKVDASDYDKRTAAHIAAAEGNLIALKLLVEHGASVLAVRDRWNNSVSDEAQQSKAAQQLMEYLQHLQHEGGGDGDGVVEE